jgi:5-methyltetrahydrofolate--homocysteine methyltransferase
MVGKRSRVLAERCTGNGSSRHGSANTEEVYGVTFRELVEGEATVITDGATGTELQRRGLPPGDCPDAWTLSHPDIVCEVARSYADAGSDAILTTTFRANAISLAPYGLAGKVGEINRAGAALARRAAGGKAAVFGSIGPSGELLTVKEELREPLAAAFREQAQALADGGADALLLETFSDIEEAKVAVEAALLTGLPVIISFAFDTGKNKDRTMTGVNPETAAREMTAAGASVVGANCGVGIEAYVPICRRMRAATSLPLWFKPNAGLPEVIKGEIRYHVTPEQFASHVPALVVAGAKFVGACCGSNPDFIRAIASVLRSAGEPVVNA